MATREENLKKINKQLEQLSDEELDEVAGGSWPGDCKINDKEFPAQQNVFQNNNPIYNAKNHSLY
ncbi:MAG: hypothetical protein IKO74_04180 [Selenomonadaceae bacterium]|nr:hypothetical protein [Selenomonadaceae bacterium]